MTRITARRLAASLALAACPFAAVAAQAETFPDKPIRLIVPYAVSYTHLTLPTILLV